MWHVASLGRVLAQALETRVLLCFLQSVEGNVLSEQQVPAEQSARELVPASVWFCER